MQSKALLITAVAVAFSSAQETPSLAAALNSTEQLSTLNTLLGAHPQVLGALANATNVTVFAPSNTALEPLAGSPLLNDSDFVTALLTYHGYNGTILAADISNTPAFPRSFLTNQTYTNVTGGQVVKARTEGDNVTITSGFGSTANVVQADVLVTNGVVHIIDNFLTIPGLVSETAVEADLDALVGALELTNLTSVVDETPDVTIFAPTTAAFEAIGSALGTLSAENVSSILQYHVINGTVAYSSLLENTTVPSLGGNLTITIVDGEVFVNQARVIAADILVANGVVHVIDSVLNPANATAEPQPDSEDAVVAFEGASSGDVPLTSGVPSPTGTNTALTATTDAVASGYTAPPGGALTSAQASLSSAAAASSSSTGIAAPVPTAAVGAVGAAALFGAAAFFADF